MVCAKHIAQPKWLNGEATKAKEKKPPAPFYAKKQHAVDAASTMQFRNIYNLVSFLFNLVSYALSMFPPHLVHTLCVCLSVVLSLLLLCICVLLCSCSTAMHRKKYDSIIHMKEASPFYFHSFTISSFPNDTNTLQTTTNNTKFTAKKTVLSYIFSSSCFANFMCFVSHSSHSFRVTSLHVLENDRAHFHKREAGKKHATPSQIAKHTRVSCTMYGTLQRNQQTQHAEMLLNYYKHTHKHIASVVFLLKFTKKIIR